MAMQLSPGLCILLCDFCQINHFPARQIFFRVFEYFAVQNNYGFEISSDMK